MLEIDELIRQRYGADASNSLNPQIWTECLTTLLSHRSVRAYLPDRLPDGTLELFAIGQYTHAMQVFYQSQHMQVPGDWVDHSIKRVADAQALSGRDRLREALQKLGFPLR